MPCLLFSLFSWKGRFAFLMSTAMALSRCPSLSTQCTSLPVRAATKNSSSSSEFTIQTVSKVIYPKYFKHWKCCFAFLMSTAMALSRCPSLSTQCTSLPVRAATKNSSSSSEFTIQTVSKVIHIFQLSTLKTHFIFWQLTIQNARYTYQQSLSSLSIM